MARNEVPSYSANAARFVPTRAHHSKEAARLERKGAGSAPFSQILKFTLKEVASNEYIRYTTKYTKRHQRIGDSFRTPAFAPPQCEVSLGRRRLDVCGGCGLADRVPGAGGKPFYAIFQIF